MFALGLLFASGIAAMVALSTILSGWVLTILWAWFVVPFGIQQIGIAHGIGICFVGRLIMGSANGNSQHDRNEDHFNKITRAVATLILTPLAPLFVGWIVKGFM